MNEKWKSKDSNYKLYFQEVCLVSINVWHKIFVVKQKEPKWKKSFHYSHLTQILPFHSHSSPPEVFSLTGKKKEQGEKRK